MAVQHDNSMGFAVRERLESLHSAYVGLEVLAGLADVDSHHVAAVAAFLNEALADCIERAGSAPCRGPSGLRSVK